MKTINSRVIAKVTGQRHTEVVRKIRTFVSYILTDARLRPSDFFIKGDYVGRNGERRTCYECTEQGCEIYANKLTGRKGTIFTAFYVKKFHEMKERLPLSSITDLLGTRNGLQALGKTLMAYSIGKPKIHYYDKQMHNPGTMTATKIAKNYGWSAQRLNKVLNKFGVIYWQGDSWTLYSQYQKLALGSYDTYPYNNNQKVSNSWKWNQRGKKFIYDVLKRHDILPQSEQLNLWNKQIMEASNHAKY